MSNSALSLRQPVALSQWSGSSCGLGHTCWQPLCVHRRAAFALRTLCVLATGTKYSIVPSMINSSDALIVFLFNCITLHLLIVGFQGCNYIFVQKEALVRQRIWSEQMIYGTLAPQFCVIVVHDGNIVPPPSCLLSSLSSMGHKSRLNFESGFYLHSRWYSEAQAVPRNSFYCTCGIHSSQIRPESNFSLDALIVQMRSFWHFRFVVVLFDDTEA